MKVTRKNTDLYNNQGSILFNVRPITGLDPRQFFVVFDGIPINLDGLLSFGFPIPTGLKHQGLACRAGAWRRRTRNELPWVRIESDHNPEGVVSML